MFPHDLSCTRARPRRQMPAATSRTAGDGPRDRWTCERRRRLKKTFAFSSSGPVLAFSVKAQELAQRYRAKAEIRPGFGHVTVTLTLPDANECDGRGLALAGELDRTALAAGTAGRPQATHADAGPGRENS